MGVQNKASGKLTLESNVQKSEDQDENLLLLLFNQLVNESGQDVLVNNSLDTVGELSKIDQAAIGVISDLGYTVIE